MEFWSIMLNKYKRLLILTWIVTTAGIAKSQTISSYSGIGIGDLPRQVFVNSQGNGGLGLSKGETFYINQLNPALLPYNVLTVFQAGMGFEAKTVHKNGSQDHYASVNLLYFGTAIPAKLGKWTFSFGVQPYSRVKYGYTVTSGIPNSAGILETTHEGNGGFNQAYLNNGFKIYKNLTVGIKAAYLFSSIIKEDSYYVNDTLNVTQTKRAFYERLNVSDFIFSGGIAYKHLLKKKTFINYGITYDPETKINVTNFERFDIRTSSGTVLTVDTLTNETSGTIRLPQKVGFGISVNNGQKWTVGVDVDYQSWSRFKNFEGNNENLTDGYSVRLGTEIIPDITNAISYFKRMTYRLGFTYDKLPYQLNQKDIKEFGINFGWSMPVSRVSSMDFALRYAVRGSTSDNLIKENFFQIHLGFTYDDRWFIRRVYD